MSEDKSSKVRQDSEAGSMSSEEAETDSDISDDPEVVFLTAEEGPSSASVERITAMNSALQSMSRQNSEIAKAVIKMTQIPMPKFDIGNLYPASILAATEAAKRATEILNLKFDIGNLYPASILAATEAAKRATEISIPKIDMAHLYPTLAITEAIRRATEITIPKFNIGNLYPASILAATEAAKRAAEISAFSVNPAFIKMASALTETTQQLAILFPDLDESLFEITREVLPENWNKDINFDNLETLIYRDGIPVVWVPSGDVLDELLEQSERNSRIQILLSASSAILDDCLRVLGEVTRERLLGQRELAIRAIGAWREHPEAAQTLAVVVADTLIMDWVKDETLSDYSKIKEGVKRDLDDVPFRNLRKVCAIAVIHTFLETWNPNSNAPLPISLSRHATIHGADPAHIHSANSMVAILLVTSLLRTFQDES